MARRRPSIFSGPVSDQPQQIQKSIQTLRLRTQEELARAQEEISRLEEEKEISELRITEVQQEINQLEKEISATQEADQKDFGQAKQDDGMRIRRWSLAGLGGLVQNRSNSEEEEQPKVRRFSLGVREKRKTSMEIEAELMDHLHEVQEKNKKAVTRRENELSFITEQVQALQLTAQSQEGIIEELEVEIAKMQTKTNVSSEPDHDGPTLQEIISSCKAEVEELEQDNNEISSSIRTIKRIREVDDSERKAIVTELKQKIIESSLKLKSTKEELKASTDFINRGLDQIEREWTMIHVQVALMELVSQKQLKRVVKKAAKGHHQDLVSVLVGAQTAIDAELTRRPRDKIPWKKATEFVESASQTIVERSQAIIEGFSAIACKQMPKDVAAVFVSILGDVKGSLSACLENTRAFMGMIDEKLTTLRADDALLPADILSRFAEEDLGASGRIGEDAPTPMDMNDSIERDDNSPKSSEQRERDELQKLEKELDELIRKECRRLEKLKQRAKKEKAVWKEKISELRSLYEKGKDDWDGRDRSLNKCFDDVADVKARERELRGILEKEIERQQKRREKVEQHRKGRREEQQRKERERDRQERKEEEKEEPKDEKRDQQGKEEKEEKERSREEREERGTAMMT